MTALGDLIATHRALYRDDTHISRLVARQPPTTIDPHTGVLHVEDGTRIGMTMSGRLLRYVSHPEGFGADFPWTKGLWRLRVECRRAHPYHRASDRPYWRGSLCWQLVIFTVCREFSVENAAKILRYDNPEPILRQALAFIEATIDRERAKQERRARDDAGRGPGAVPTYSVEQRHDQPGMHAAECPRCRRAA